jgi:signal transduction histidine kinase
MALIIVLVFAISQNVVMRGVYEGEALTTVSTNGKEIEDLLKKPVPEPFEGNRSAYVRYLATYYDVNIFVLSREGELLFPQFPTDAPTRDFSSAVKTLMGQLGKGHSAVYKTDVACVYGAKLALYDNAEIYLYVEESLDLLQTATTEMVWRTVFIALFVFLLTFAVAIAVAGWLTKPLTEMTKKARKLADGDFDVDFYHDAYGSEMRELARTLNYARDEISKTDKMQRELIANVSHDFKTPLTMIKGYAHMIADISGGDPQKRAKHAQIIVNEADRLTSLVSDVLDLSKMRAGMDEFKLQIVDLSSYLEEILARFHYLKDTQGYSFTEDIDEDIYALVDEMKIGQALYNLIGNAVNYTGEDKRVFVQLKREEGAVRFSVTDTGEGIKSEDIATIWERYYRSGETHKRPVGGTGLGLSIVKTVLDKHGFLYGVESEIGKGSTFYILFPLIAEEGANG